ncbi:hypothetical protein [Methanoregula sp.]|uniref:hypothetical protein n=1 Tax=Methanoregula sp. TaxID=2052170 RepID=UPI002C9A9FDB|nr:hypothetical protein [Methanoregula sp.]HVP96169.1 hypothetical protein [Methanoregula sp.]
MDKKDITYIIAAFCIILVIAFIVKPIATGQPVNTGLPKAISEPSITSTPQVVYSNLTTIQTTTPPTPTPTWNQKVQTIGFVNPATYQISTNQSLPQGTPINASLPDNRRTVYATISGTYSGTTQVVTIPFPYWELSYSITPPQGYDSALPSYSITPTYGQGASISGFQGSYSTVQPQFSIQVMDATDPNRIVRTITPPGGIDFNLWEGITPTTPSTLSVTLTPAKYGTIMPTATTPSMDPRPWLEKFYEGGRGYYFVINSQNIGSYTITILVPTRYIGQY